MYTLSKKEIEQRTNDIEILIINMIEILDLIKNPSKDSPERYKNYKRNWNLRVLSGQCNEITDISNYIINNS